MSWTRYLLHDFWTAAELNRMDHRASQMRRIASASRADLRQRIDELEDDLGRVALLTHALAEACVQSGVLRREQISAMAEKLDLADGVADGRLDLSGNRAPDEQPQRPLSPNEHLRQLEKRGLKDPKEFLGDLESASE